MMKHIFTLLWNQKRVYGGMFVEQIIVFFLLLFCCIVIGEKSRLYFTNGMIDTKNMLTCYLSPIPNAEHPPLCELQQKMDQVVGKVRMAPFVIAFGKSMAMVPYMRPEEMNPSDSILIGQRKVKVLLKLADEHMFKVFNPQLEEGKWLTSEPLDDGSYPVVITRQLKDEMEWSQGVRKKIYYDGTEFSVVGVISGIKQEPLKPSYPTMIAPNCIDKGSKYIEYTVRIKEGEASNFRKLMNKEFYKMMGDDNVELSIADVEKWKQTRMQGNYIALAAIIVPTLFLFIFAFIGTFGLFWLYSSKRRKEFALRIVVGSTPSGLKCFVILESLLLMVLAWIPGILLFFWIYPISGSNLFALGATCFIMVLFSVYSAWWPAYQVSRLNLVEAMRDE